MDKGTAVFYHKHIQSNIARLDERKDRFIHHRIDFLKEYCLPIQEKISMIRQQIQKYKIMRDTQQQVIQSEPQIVRLKEQVANYQHTREYFSQKVNEYEQKSLQYEQYNKDLKRRLELLNNSIKNHQEDSNVHLPFIAKQRVYSIQNQQDSRSIHSKSFALPSIRDPKSHKDTESSLNQSKIIHKPKIVNISEKIQRFKHLRSLQHSKAVVEDEIVNDQPRQQPQQKEKRKQLQSIRQRITQFNKTQTLFNDCFEVKKNSVQRSVSQLQSKLIANRDQFLATCQAIGAKQSNVSFDDFKKLSSEQILTLFISFAWLNKRLKSQYVAKRKQIMQYIGKLPKVQS